MIHTHTKDRSIRLITKQSGKHGKLLKYLPEKKKRNMVLITYMADLPNEGKKVAGNIQKNAFISIYLFFFYLHTKYDVQVGEIWQLTLIDFSA